MEKEYCKSIFRYLRRYTNKVGVGNIVIGGDEPIVIQSMGTVSSNDVEGASNQAISIADSGAKLVRFTAQGVREAENLGVIREMMNNRGCKTPLVADIHFNPAAAFAAASLIEKVRINPGNFVDRKRNGCEFTEQEYNRELERIDEAFTRLIEICRENKTAIRVGVNHGSLSERIVDRYGDTPEGMTESAMEFLRVAVKRDFKNVVVSLKSSNTQIMIHAYRMLASAMECENMTFPLHLGVTEAGEGAEGRIRSAVGIGALLADGLGDTIRVSLTEKPENEVVFANLLINYIEQISISDFITQKQEQDLVYLKNRYNPFITKPANIPQMVITAAEKDTYKDDLVLCDSDYSVIDIADVLANKDIKDVKTIVVKGENPQYFRTVFLWLDAKRDCGEWSGKAVAYKCYNSDAEFEQIQAMIGVDFGALLVDGFADAIWIDCKDVDNGLNKNINREQLRQITLSLLQATRRRVSTPEYISCPGCGRTLYDIQDVVRRVKEATIGLKNIKIAIMGCIVNGPGEMADADYGYVGAARGEVTLYKAGKPVVKNIKESEAIDKLIDLLKENNEFKA